MALVVAVAAAVFDMGGFDLTQFLRVGEQAWARDFVEADLPDTHVVPGWGHDGQANYVLAAVFPDLAEADGYLDSVTYRSRRIVYPALLSWVPRGMPLVTAMWLLNLAAIAGAAAALAALARRHRASWLVGAAVGATPAFVASMVVDLGDALALALGAAGVLAWRRDRGTAVAVGLFTVAALTRETTLVIPAAVFIAEGRGRRLPLLLPPAVIVAWIALLEIWIGGPGKSAAQFRLPLFGWVDQGLGSPEVLIAFTLAVGSAWVARRLWDHDRTWALVLLFDLAVLVCVDQAVLFNVLNLTRVTPWVVPLAVLVVSARWPERSTDENGRVGEVDPVPERLVDRAALHHGG